MISCNSVKFNVIDEKEDFNLNFTRISRKVWKKELLCCNSLIFSVAGVGHDPTTSGL